MDDAQLLEVFRSVDLSEVMREYTRLIRHEERERCAKVCDAEADIANMQARQGGSAMDDGRAIGAEACAEAIRAIEKEAGK